MVVWTLKYDLILLIIVFFERLKTKESSGGIVWLLARVAVHISNEIKLFSFKTNLSDMKALFHASKTHLVAKRRRRFSKLREIFFSEIFEI